MTSKRVIVALALAACSSGGSSTSTGAAYK